MAGSFTLLAATVAVNIIKIYAAKVDPKSQLLSCHWGNFFGGCSVLENNKVNRSKNVTMVTS